MNIRALEHPYSHVRLICTSPIELTHRITAVSKERETVSFVEAMRPGELFFDIGANTGAYSLIAASRGIEVVAFEPHGPTFARLKENIHLNDLNVTPFRFALSDHDGEAGLEASSDLPGSASHAMRLGEEFLCWRLDSFIEAWSTYQPTWIKIDTDGHEVEVLTGAKETLRHVRGVQVEVSDDFPGQAQAICDLLQDAGLLFTAAHRHGKSPISNWQFLRPA